MDLAVAAAPAGRERLRAVRAWWRERRPGPTIGQRLDLLYTIAISAAILGALAYGTASSALAQVVTPSWLAQFGPPIALGALLMTARWGGYHGPVVYSVPDVTHLLGAPLPRSGLAVGRLRSALAAGAAAGALAAGARDRRPGGRGPRHRRRAARPASSPGSRRSARSGSPRPGPSSARRAGTASPPARSGPPRSSPWGSRSRRAPAMSGARSRSGRGRGAGRSSPGPRSRRRNGWQRSRSSRCSPRPRRAPRSARAGDCPTERHLRRAEARASALAGLTSFDARSARLALRGAADDLGRPRRGGGLPRLRRVAATPPPQRRRPRPLARRGDRAAHARTRRRGRRPRGRGRRARAHERRPRRERRRRDAARLPRRVADALVAACRARPPGSGAPAPPPPPRAGGRRPRRPAGRRRRGGGRARRGVCAVAGGLGANGAAAVAVALGRGARRHLLRGDGRAPRRAAARERLRRGRRDRPVGRRPDVIAWLAIWPALAAALGAAPLLVVAHGEASSGLVAAGATLAVAMVLAGVLAGDPDTA